MAERVRKWLAQRAERLPDDVPLVVHPQPRAALRERAPTMLLLLIMTVMATYFLAITGFGETTSIGWLAVGLIGVAGLVIEALLLRSILRLGPKFAADKEHLWLRSGGLLKPRSMRLAWVEIATVTLRLWHGRRGTTARFVTFDLTEEAAAALAADPTFGRRARRLARIFGSPVAIAERAPDRFLDDALHTMRDLAPEAVKFARDS